MIIKRALAPPTRTLGTRHERAMIKEDPGHVLGEAIEPTGYGGGASGGVAAADGCRTSTVPGSQD